MIKLKGVFSAIITPYNESGDIDTGSFRELIQYQLSEGISGFLVGGSTGEGLLLSIEERKLLTETAVKSAGGEGSVIIHVGAISTNDCLALTKHAQDVGADAVAAIPPIYFSTNQESIVDHYISIADATDLPVYAYHIPSATHVNLYRDIMSKLAEVPNIVGMKYTDPNLDEMHYMATQISPSLNVLYGRDEMLLAGLMMGADGGVGSTYNVMPGAYAAICELSERGEWEEAKKIQFRVCQVIEALKKYGVFPSLKAILEDAGFQTGECRKPTLPLKGKKTDLLADLSQHEYSREIIDL